jgi:anti-repressor protein
MSKVVSITPAFLSTREFAKLTNRTHGNVLTLVRSMLKRAGFEAQPSYYHNVPNGQRFTEYRLTLAHYEQMVDRLKVVDMLAVFKHFRVGPHDPRVTQLEAPAPVPVVTGMDSGKPAEQSIPLVVDSTVASMTSLDMSELVGSRHNNVKVAIERLMEKGIIQYAALQHVKNLLGRSVEVYVFRGLQGKRDSIIVMAQLSPEFTAVLVDRWQQLEAQLAKPVVAANLNDAASLRGLLLGYTEQVLKLEEKITQDAPKVEFFNNVAVSEDSQTVQDVAKQFGVGPNRFFKLLRDLKILMSYPQQNVPYQKHMDAEHFEVELSEYKVPDTETVKLASRTFITGKGLIYLERRLNALGYFRKMEKAA